MNLLTPARLVLFAWLLIAATGFVPVEISGRLKLANILDVLLCCVFLGTFLIFLARGRALIRVSRLSIAFFFLSLSWIPGLAFSESMDYELERFCLWLLLAIAVQVAFILPKVEYSLVKGSFFFKSSALLLSVVVIVTYVIIGKTEYGRVTLPSIEQGALVYRYVENVGLLPDPNVFSYGLIFIYFLALRYERPKLTTLSILVIALILIGSRSALLAFIVVSGIWLSIVDKAMSQRFLLIIPVAIVGSLLVDFSQFDIVERFKNPENYAERAGAWSAFFNDYSSSGLKVIFGFGFGAARASGDPHNFYISTFYDGGIIALLCLLFVYYSAFRHVFKELSGASKHVANAMLCFNLLIGLFYWQNQMFFVPFFGVWLMSAFMVAKAR